MRDATFSIAIGLLAGGLVFLGGIVEFSQESNVAMREMRDEVKIAIERCELNIPRSQSCRYVITAEVVL